LINIKIFLRKLIIEQFVKESVNKKKPEKEAIRFL